MKLNSGYRCKQSKACIKFVSVLLPNHTLLYWLNCGYRCKQSKTSLKFVSVLLLNHTLLYWLNCGYRCKHPKTCIKFASKSHLVVLATLEDESTMISIKIERNLHYNFANYQTTRPGDFKHMYCILSNYRLGLVLKLEHKNYTSISSAII